MARSLSTRLVTLALPALASCSFLLDFEELREGGPRPPEGGAAGSGAGSAGRGGAAGSSGKGGSAGKGGQGGSAGSTEAGAAGESGAGGEGGASVACPPECMDDDPCTLDGCTSTGACRHTVVPGLVLDGIDERMPADQHFRVTMAAAPDGFFLSSFSATDGTPELSLYRLGAEASSVTEIATISDFNLAQLDGGEPLSAAGLAVEPGFGLVHAYVALRDRSGTGARVWHLVLDMSYTPQVRVPVGQTYWSDSPYNHPVALNLRGDVYAAWIAGDQSIVLDGGVLTAPVRLALGAPASTATLIGTAGGDPVVLYTAANGGVYLESPTITTTPIEECQMLPGGYLSSSATDTSIPGFWLTSWTKVGPATQTEEGYLTTDGRGVGCAAAGCMLEQLNCSADSASNLVRNQVLLSGVRPGDPNGVVSLIQALPYITAEAGGVTAELVLRPSRVDFGRVPFQMEPEVTPLGEPIVVSSLPTTAPDFRGPDWPAMAFVPPHHVALSFIEPAETGDELRVQRYRVCYPD